MKIKLQLAAMLAALLMISNAFPVCAVNTDGLSEATTFSQNNTLIFDNTRPEEWETMSSGDTSGQASLITGTAGADMAVPAESPMFSAHIDYSPQGYVAIGTFTEFLPDTSLVRPLYSLDGEVWHVCQTTWNLQWLDSETAEDLQYLQNQKCLFGTDEPLASYLAGQLDRFYLKLQITLENEITYETQGAVIDRGDPQPLPKEFTPVAAFVPSMRIRQWKPPNSYGQYQITVSANATPEDISSHLPDTLPIEIQLYTGIDFYTNAIVDCPVIWKPLSLSRLTAGESVTIEDAAEEIIIPAGTLLNTPHGIFYLNDPLDFNQKNVISPGASDKIKLILNVVAENADPTGVLACENNGLQIAFHLKPTGATAIRAYTFSESGADWVELPDPLLPEEVNTPSSAASSAYTFVLSNTSEPYQSYLAAGNARDELSRFFVGLKIEGGVYDGRQLILAWPDTYELPAGLPDLKGSGGNECNAGSDNKNDSTSEGQRPGLPQNAEDRPDSQDPEPPQYPKGEQDSQDPELPQYPKDEQGSQDPELPQYPKDEQNTQKLALPQNPIDEQNTRESELPQLLEAEQNAQNPEPPQTSEYKPQTPPPASYIPEAKSERASETIPLLIAGAENPASAPAVNAETTSSAWESTEHKAEHSLHWLLLPAATTAAIGITIAAGKTAAGGMFGKISGKIIHALYRLLHLK